MRKRQQNIIIWFITWASLLLLVLYSPIGSPDLYRPNSYYINTRGVVFNSSAFTKSTQLNSKAGNANIQPYSSESNLRTSYSVSKNNYNKNVNYSLPMINNNHSERVNKNDGNGNNESGFIAMSSRKSTTEQGNNTVLQSNLISTSTDLSLLADNNTTRQGGTAEDPLGTTDPGGDPFGPPIPVPDGWGFLLVLAGIYVVVKKYILK